MLFDVVISDRGDWRVGSCLEEEDQVFNTDESRKGGNIRCRNIRPRSWEVCTIDACPRRCMARNDLSRKRIVIASDSQAGLKGLGSMMFRSRLVFECRRNLIRLSRRAQLRLIWVPGHSGILGNESADLLVREQACQT